MINIQNVSKISKNNHYYKNDQSLNITKIIPQKRSNFQTSLTSIQKESKYNDDFSQDFHQMQLSSIAYVEKSEIEIKDFEFTKTKINQISESCNHYDITKEISQSTSNIIELPGNLIYLKHLEINRPITLKGKSGTVIVIEEGPIIINLGKNTDSVKFFQIDFIFKPKIDSMSYNITEPLVYYLFKIYPGSLLEIEMCNISAERSKNIPQKFFCFQILSQQISNNSFNLQDISGNSNKLKEIKIKHWISYLKLSSSKISKFDQTIRAGENSIIEIENCVFDYNIGKVIVLLNPIILRLINTVFEMNLNNIIHIKYIKNKTFDDKQSNNFKINNDFSQKSKIYLEGNEFTRNYGCGIQLEGEKGVDTEIEILINKCIFKKNKGNSIFISDIIIQKLRIDSCSFLFNGENGIYLQNIKLYFILFNSNLVKSIDKPNEVKFKELKDEQINNKHIEYILTTMNLNTYTESSNDYKDFLPVIRKNKFIDNDLCGIFINNVQAIISENEFIKNKAGGIIFCDINESNKHNQIIKEREYKILSTTNKNINHLSQSSDCGNYLNTYIQKCDFIKNGGSGIKITKYDFFISICNCLFQENIEYGLYIEGKSELVKEKIQKFKSFESNQSTNDSLSNYPNETNVLFSSSKVLFNLRSGIYLNNKLLYIKESGICDNIHYAIEIPEENQKNMFIIDKKSEKMLNGTLGGNWGEVSISQKFNCVGCLSTEKKVKKYIIREKKNNSYDKDNKRNNENEENEGKGSNCDIF